MEALQEYEPYLKNPPTIISGDMNIEVQRYELLAWDKAISDHVGQMMEIIEEASITAGMTLQMNLTRRKITAKS